MSKDWQAAKSPAASKRHVQFAGTWKEFVAVTGAIVLLMTVMVTAASGPRKGEVAASASNLFGTVFGILCRHFSYQGRAPKKESRGSPKVNIRDLSLTPRARYIHRPATVRS